MLVEAVNGISHVSHDGHTTCWKILLL